MRHTLISYDENKMAGICAKCGKVKIVRKKNSHNELYGFRCKIAKNEQRGTPSKETQLRNKILVYKMEDGTVIKIKASKVKEIKANFEQKCSICGTTDKKLKLDHCHKTGKMRGLLCHFCNVGIGLFKDDIAILKNAIIYLEK